MFSHRELCKAYDIWSFALGLVYIFSHSYHTPSKPAGLLIGQNWNLELSQGITLILSNVFSFTLSIFCLLCFSHVNYLLLTYLLKLSIKEIDFEVSENSIRCFPLVEFWRQCLVHSLINDPVVTLISKYWMTGSMIWKIMQTEVSEGDNILRDLHNYLDHTKAESNKRPYPRYPPFLHAF